jgi:hypothetical protein
MKLTLVLTLAFTLLVSATPGSNVHNAADVAKVAANPGSSVAMVDCEDCKNRYQFCFDVSVLSWGMWAKANSGGRTDVPKARRDARRRVRSMWCIRRLM